ncbi:DNA primase catalytic subunit PriS [Methanothermococcus sp. Ax23]
MMNKIHEKQLNENKIKILDEVKKHYKEYFIYAIKRKWLEIPDEIHHKEIGFGYLKKVDNRNISFDSEKEYLKWVLENAPFHLYKSLSYMEHPDFIGGASQKKILKREMAFDIDVHRVKKCTHEDDGWICKYCLEEAKNQAFILIDEFLISDFGLSKNDLKIVFSGNRGYHIYIKPQDEEIKNTIEHWDRYQRRYFIEYILGKNLNLNYVGSGWSRRILNNIKNKQIKTQLSKTKNWKQIIDKKNENDKNKILSIIENTKNRLELDEKVMEDDIRLLRVIGSLHGYTGFIVKEIKYNSLEYFNPLNHAVFSKFNKEYYNVKINQKIDSLRIKDKTYTTRSKEIPASMLLFLFGHGVDFEILD